MSDSTVAMRRVGRTALFACAALAALGAFGGASAQEAGAELETVIVTARRVEENLQSVPVAVTALSERQLEAQSIVNVSDLQRVSPGLTIAPTGSGASRPGYQIRGQRATASGLAFDPAIAVYFGEVSAGRAAGTLQSIYDLTSIQVLKGPQGTLFGRNTTGGAILLTPRTPTMDFEGYLSGSTGNYNLQDVEGVINVPVSDKLQVRLAGKYYRRDGYFHNMFNNQYAYDEDNSSLRLSVRVKPTESITSDFVFTKFYANISGFQPKLFDVNLAFTPAPFRAAFQNALARSNALGFYEYEDPFQSRNKDDVKGAQNITTIELGEDLGVLGSARLKNIIGYRKLKNRFSSYADGSILGALETFGTYRGDQFSNELQLQGESGKVEYILGLFYSEEEGVEFNHLKNFGALPRSINEYEARNVSKSAFVHLNYDLGDAVEGLTLSGGVRVTRDNRYIDAHYRQERAPTPGPRFVCNLPGLTVPLNITDIFTQRGACSQVTRANFTEPTWDVSLNWQVNDDHLLYLAHRHGYRAGSAALLIAPELRPEKVDDIEIGSKNTFDLAGHTARFNVAIYYGKYKDLQRSIAALLNGVAATATFNAAKSHVYGLEADFQTRLTDNFSLAASYALTIAKYDEYNNLVGGVPIDNTSALFGFTPKHALNLSVTYDLPLDASLGSASLSVNYAYQSKMHGSENNTLNPADPGWFANRETGMIPGYGLFGARADWRKPGGAPFDLGFFVTNLADKKYQSGRYGLTSVLGFATYFPGAPRMYGVELKVPFGAAAN